ncbi:AEC family transporter [Botrimarina hoheduenensis]|uniref:Membrane transport protein n=1 Tax=Botrimarina hoheduenensis TaxID=2528000 RepID=A0A5C5WCZ8_9BACT|nr:AEC family transporter [Botrimarina hoheduenensis]TWT47542.1 Membrane transport protein [Botrimarina hoheduenensis]
MSLALILAPVFVLILLGATLNRWGFPGAGFWGPAEQLTYYVLFPALILTTLSEADLSQLAWKPLAVGLAAAITAITAVTLVTGTLTGCQGPKISSLVQGAIRMNTYVGLAVASWGFGAAGLAYAAVSIAIIVPLVNTLCVAVLAIYAEPTVGGSSSGLVRGLCSNPLILACIAGITLNASGYAIPPIADEVTRVLGRAALPLGLLAVGAALRAEAFRRLGWPEALASAAKLLVLPALASALLLLLGVEGQAFGIGIVFTALPTAPSSYLLAKQMGGDAESMAAMVTCQTLAAAITLPGWLTWINSF